MRNLLTVLTVVEILLVVGVLARYLALITRSLRASSALLAKVTFGVRAIETQCEPIGPAVTRINGQLAVIAGALAGVAGLAEGAADAAAGSAPSPPRRSRGPGRA